MTRKEELGARVSDIAGEHYDCEDRWYSCPLSSEGCCDEYAGTDCTCGVTARQRVILAALLQVEREVWERVAEHCHYKHNDGYTLNDVLGCGNEGDVVTGASNDELRNIEEWARAQQQELT